MLPSYTTPPGHVPQTSTAIDHRAVRAALRESGIQCIVYLPESPLEQLVNDLIDAGEFRLIPVPRESVGMSLCAGLTYGGKRVAWLGSYKGFYNAIDTYLGVARKVEASFLVLISEGKRVRNPEQLALDAERGRHSEALLQALDIPYYEVNTTDEANRIVQAARDTATAIEPVAVILRW
jgi:sulfopyruvate decarboxylase TPP-binding subunit